MGLLKGSPIDNNVEKFLSSMINNEKAASISLNHLFGIFLGVKRIKVVKVYF